MDIKEIFIHRLDEINYCHVKKRCVLSLSLLGSISFHRTDMIYILDTFHRDTICIIDTLSFNNWLKLTNREQNNNIRNCMAKNVLICIKSLLFKLYRNQSLNTSDIRWYDTEPDCAKVNHVYIIMLYCLKV